MRRRKSNIPIGSFNPSYHYEMLIDKRRVEPYKLAIERAVNNSSIVLDVGTGSGLLAILAARAGAKKVYSIERMADIRELATSNFKKENNASLQLPILDEDATGKLDLPELVDVFVCELLSTWLVTEQQAAVSQSVRPLMKSDGVIIPCRMKNYVTGAHAELDYYGGRISHPYYIRELRDSRPLPLTSTELTHITDFNQVSDMNVHIESIEITCHTSGVLNSIVLESDADLGDEITVGDGQTLFLPHVFPLQSELKVQAGDKVFFNADYQYGGDWMSFTAEIKH